MQTPKPFVFEISLSVLNHLGRNLYRNFITVLGEAISNAWDADAKNVHIYIDRESGSFVIKDDGDGMTYKDFQEKFLKVGYSKRKDNGLSSPGRRPYIGAKGIGKLALLSCAEKISVISKTENSEYVGGVIDNSGLSKAIEHDLTPDKYPLGAVNMDLFNPYISGHSKGTIIHFEESREDIKNTIPYLKKLIALYFRFSLVDKTFKIFLNDSEVTLEDLKKLSETTEFIWNINNLKDPFLGTLSHLKNEPLPLGNELKIEGFIATVEKPRYLKITGTEEKVGIDLFVNGRLREKDILKHAPDFSTRYIASYLYGQIHYSELDRGGKDSFTTSREGVVPGNQEYDELIRVLKESLLEVISNKWDELRLARGEEGDDENPRKTLIERRARSLYYLSASDYSESGNEKVKDWLKDLVSDAEFNIPAYVDCFVSENLVRKYISEKGTQLTGAEQRMVNELRVLEAERKVEGNINIEIRQNGDNLSYLEMKNLANVAERAPRGPLSSLAVDALTFRPIRNAVMHTALLSNEAKKRLSTVFENIKARIKTLLTVS